MQPYIRNFSSLYIDTTIIQWYVEQFFFLFCSLSSTTLNKCLTFIRNCSHALDQRRSRFNIYPWNPPCIPWQSCISIDPQGYDEHHQQPPTTNNNINRANKKKKSTHPFNLHMNSNQFATGKSDRILSPYEFALSFHGKMCDIVLLSNMPQFRFVTIVHHQCVPRWLLTRTTEVFCACRGLNVCGLVRVTICRLSVHLHPFTSRWRPICSVSATRGFSIILPGCRCAT